MRGLAVFITLALSIYSIFPLLACGTNIFMDDLVAAPLIIHGFNAVLGQFPWQGGLYADGSFSCGCSYIGGDYVLTAGHCVDFY